MARFAARRLAAAMSSIAPEPARCAFTRFEHERWEAAVRPYDRIFGSLTAQAARHVVDTVLRHGESGPGLDCATGPGYVVEEALRRGVPATDLVGTDFSAAMLDRARERVAEPSVTWLEADIQECPPADLQGRFAWCICNFGVLHLARPESFFAAARAALQPGGILAFTVWAELGKSPAFQIPLQAIEKHGSTDVGLPPGPPFFKFSDPSTAAKALGEAGFECSSICTELVDMEWFLDRPEDLWEVFCEGTARTGGMLERQEPSARERIEAAMREAVIAAQPPQRVVPPYVLVQPCLLVTAQVPAGAD